MALSDLFPSSSVRCYFCLFHHIRKLGMDHLRTRVGGVVRARRVVRGERCLACTWREATRSGRHHVPSGVTTNGP